MATENTENHYELMVIMTPVLAEDEYKAAQKKFTKQITEAGGSIVNENAWGVRSLAYPIEKKTTGLYYVLEYTAPADYNAKLEVQMNRDESIMRHMITRLDKYAQQYNERKRKGIKLEMKSSKSEAETADSEETADAEA